MCEREKIIKGFVCEKENGYVLSYILASCVCLKVHKKERMYVCLSFKVVYV